jgi:hypothetical protein
MVSTSCMASASPTAAPTAVPSASPTDSPTHAPTDVPTDAPTDSPTHAPTDVYHLISEPEVTEPGSGFAVGQHLTFGEGAEAWVTPATMGTYLH